MNRDTLNLAVIALALRDLPMVPWVAIIALLSWLGILQAARHTDKKSTDDYDAAMMADNGSGSRFARQRIRTAAARYYSVGPAPTALPPAQD